MINPSNEPAKPKKIITIIPSGQLTESIPDTQPESDKSDSTSEPGNSSIFQAIGVIAGTVDLKALPHPTISIENRDFAAFKEKKANIAASKGNKPKPKPQTKPVKKAQPKTQTKPVQPPTTPHQTQSQ